MGSFFFYPFQAFFLIQTREGFPCLWFFFIWDLNQNIHIRICISAKYELSIVWSVIYITLHPACRNITQLLYLTLVSSYVWVLNKEESVFSPHCVHLIQHWIRTFRTRLAPRDFVMGCSLYLLDFLFLSLFREHLRTLPQNSFTKCSVKSQKNSKTQKGQVMLHPLGYTQESEISTVVSKDLFFAAFVLASLWK